MYIYISYLFIRFSMLLGAQDKEPCVEISSNENLSMHLRLKSERDCNKCEKKNRCIAMLDVD